MPLQSARIEKDLPAVLPTVWNAPEELGINVVDKNRAPAVQSRSSGILVKPQVVGDNDAVCEGG